MKKGTTFTKLTNDQVQTLAFALGVESLLREGVNGDVWSSPFGEDDDQALVYVRVGDVTYSLSVRLEERHTGSDGGAA